MTSMSRKARRRQGLSFFPVVWAVAMLAFQTRSIDFAKAQSTASKTYRTTAGDKIGVTVFGQPNLSGEATIDQVGNIRLPLVGDVQAVNLTLGEIEGSIARALTPGYIRNPTVTARIAEIPLLPCRPRNTSVQLTHARLDC